MVTFEVNDMSCGHCTSTITQAVKSVDANAKVEVDLAGHRVEIESLRADPARLRDAIGAAGFTPVLVS